MKGERTLQILEAVARFTSDTVMDAGDFLMAFLSAGYGASYGQLRHEYEKQREGSRVAEAEAAELQRMRVILAKLKHDGLIDEQKPAAGKQWRLRLTWRGREKLTALSKRKEKTMPPAHYTADHSAKFTIVTFDIAERERQKRDWLRDVLRNLKFTMLQKSVWIGKVKVPEALLDDLKKYRLLGAVEIFEISKGGSLRQVA